MRHEVMSDTKLVAQPDKHASKPICELVLIRKREWLSNHKDPSADGRRDKDPSMGIRAHTFHPRAWLKITKVECLSDRCGISRSERQPNALIAKGLWRIWLR
jgi:hypothetical protein